MVEFCIHVANFFYLASFLTRDIFWLRTLTCCGLSLGVVFFTCQPAPMYGPAAWHLLFLAINIVQIYGLCLERRELRLTGEQERMAEAVFQDLSREELVTLLTQVMCKSPEHVRDIPNPCPGPLSPEQRALRDIAFKRLTRREIVILLTRRLWRLLRIVPRTRIPWRRRLGEAGSQEAG